MGNALSIDGHWFIDSLGRKVLLRGMNLGGSSKLPVRPNGATHLPTDYHDHRTVSFIGRPFPLEEADEHYDRLRRWGFNCLRFVITWEAIEHAGPGIYDTEYLDYLERIIQKAGEYGFYVFIDPHQDMWSRMTGGDGAPGWTLELAGLDISRLDACEAAITMAARYPQYGRMTWGNNATRLATATMFTLFFAGNRFAPLLKMQGENAQDFLQNHFIQAMVEVAKRLAPLPHVIGYDSLNEPKSGYIGVEDLRATPLMWVDGALLTWFEGMSVPAGFLTEVPVIEFQGIQPAETGTVVLNPQGLCAWAPPELDIWRQHGVWEVDGRGHPVVLRPNYFAGVQFFADCLKPFIHRYIDAIRAVHPDALIFVEGEPGSLEPVQIDAPVPLVNASHWYDVLTLYRKHFDPAVTLEYGTFRIVEGMGSVRELFKTQIGMIKDMAQEYLNGAPTLIGEFGLPFDLDDGYAYRTGDYACPIDALSAYYDAMDAHLVHSTQWNYTADNDNQWGDQWNQEDLSIFSRDQQADPQDPNSGARALTGFCRPHLLACAGTPLRQAFNQDNGDFWLEIQPDPQIFDPTLIYLAQIQYPQGFKVTASSGRWEYNPVDQCLTWHDMLTGPQNLVITRV